MELKLDVPQDILAELQASAKANRCSIEEYVERLIQQRIDEDRLLDEIYEFEVAQRGYENQQTTF